MDSATTMTSEEFASLSIPTGQQNTEYSKIEGGSKPTKRNFRRWNTKLTISILLSILAISYFFYLRRSKQIQCIFCDQPKPILHEDKSYKLWHGAVVTPMTITYEYELYDGQMVYTNSAVEHIPNLDFDYAILAITTARNLHRDTNTPVSLDEVYLHHFGMYPINVIGPETIAGTKENPYMQIPDGYALHVLQDENPVLRVNGHLMSNKNIAPIDGSVARARKECNECYYAPGKGSDCTPELSGTFFCCGDSFACMVGGEDCACATTTSASNANNKKETTKYRLELDLLISRDIDHFERLDRWNFAAPACSVNVLGEGVFDNYTPDDFCFDLTGAENLDVGGGSMFHTVPMNNEEPMARNKISAIAPAGGTIFWAMSHLHSGAVNATLLLNGDEICSTNVIHGTNPDMLTNAGNEANHLVEITSCDEQIGSEGIRFEPGDIFTIETIYYAGTDDQRMTDLAVAGERKNAMSMFFTAILFDGSSQLLTERRTSWNYWNNFVPIAGPQHKIWKKLYSLDA